MSICSERNPDGGGWFALVAVVLLSGVLVAPAFGQNDAGIGTNLLTVGGVMDLEGRSRGLGQGMKTGIEAAIRNKTVNGRKIEFVTLDDSYTPSKTIASTRALIEQGVFAMVGNVGTPTARVSLPILAEAKVPAIGFFTGAGLLRPGRGDIINFRASYVQETAAVISAALENGVKPTQICAFVQNDAYGMAGVVGIKRALESAEGADAVVATLDQILAAEGENPARNNLGPVGVYQRNTFTSRDGYQSLKLWEEINQAPCRLVVTVGTYNAIARFAGYARYKNETWTISAVSFTGADNFQTALNDLGVNDNVLMTQVVPSLNSELPIVKQAREALGDDFGYVTLEGYVVGQIFLKILSETPEPLSREGFLNAARGSVFNLGGLVMNFSGDNQGSDLVLLTHLDGGDWHPMSKSKLTALFQ